MRIGARQLLAVCAMLMLLALADGVQAQTAMRSARGMPYAPVPVDTGMAAGYTPTTYFGSKSLEKFDIAFRQASLREVLQFLAWISDVNIMIPEGVEGVVNANFTDISLAGALTAVIKANKLEYTLEEGVIRLGKEEVFKESGEDLKTETFRLHFAPANTLVDKVQKILTGRGSVVEDQRTNSLVVRELQGNLDNVRRFIADVDIKDAQVLIESKLLEAKRTFSRGLGIQWGVTKGGANSNFRVAGVQAVGTGDSGRALNVNLPAANPTSGLLIGSLFKGVNLDAQILAAESRGDVYVISDPSIVTTNGEAAKIRSGATIYLQGTGQVNIGTASGTTTTGSSSLEEIETGVELNVTPQITMGDYVRLDIETTTSTPDFANAVQGIPIVLDNTATTTVLVRDGETTVIGGLSRYSDSNTKKRVPGLHKIPVLGNLFKSSQRDKENNELLVFIRPTIVRTEGLAPAQMRVREIDARRQEMTLAPLTDPIKEAQEKAERARRKQEEEQSRRGNKYVR